MELLIILVEKVLPVFALIAVGFVYGKTKSLETKSLSDLILTIALPCFAFVSVIKIKLTSTDLLISAIAPIIVSFGVFGGVYLFLKISGNDNLRGFYLPTVFSNAGNMALPVAFLAYGDLGISSALVYMVVLGILIFTLGFFMVSGTISFTLIYRQYVLYGIGLGFLFNILGMKIPDPIFTALEMVSSITIPLLLVILGYNLNIFAIRSLKLALVGSFFRIGLGFLIAWFIFIKILGLTDIAAKTIVLLSAMPAAVIVYPIAEKYNAQPEIVASVIVMSTIVSFVSIPLTLWLLG